MILIKDNSDISEYKSNSIIQELKDRDLANLEKDGFIVFPSTLIESDDLDKDSQIFTSHNEKIRTGNIVGFLKKGKNEIRICSRFYDAGVSKEDYFLRYLLQKVLNINVVNTNINTDSNNEFYDLLVYLFPIYFENALNKGVYKEYTTKKYNNANVKGVVNIAKHLKTNIPFQGKIAYETREFSFDNKITQLVRHTLEKLRKDYELDFLGIENIKENIRSIEQVTQTYSKLDRLDVLQENISNPVRHGYFKEYYLLQKICIKILNEDKIAFGEEDQEAQGIIIDVAWLWEEYLNTLLKEDYEHPQNKKSSGGISLFIDRTHAIYPDFYKVDKTKVIDAKYKNLDQRGMKREDRYQIISYLHILKAQSAGIAYPSRMFNQNKDMGILDGYGGRLFKIPLLIPQDSKSYEEFCEIIKQSEQRFVEELDLDIFGI